MLFDSSLTGLVKIHGYMPMTISPDDLTIGGDAPRLFPKSRGSHFAPKINPVYPAL